MMTRMMTRMTASVATPVRGLVVALLLPLALLTATPVHAVQPEEMLEDPKLEARARQISENLRCLVCRNESIDDSNAELARDLRLLVRERLQAGDTNEEVVDYVVERYGEFVLLRPRFSAGNALIWLAGPMVFLIGAGIAAAYLLGRRPGGAKAEAPLSEDEKRRLRDVLGD